MVKAGNTQEKRIGARATQKIARTEKAADKEN